MRIPLAGPLDCASEISDSDVSVPSPDHFLVRVQDDQSRQVRDMEDVGRLADLIEEYREVQVEGADP